MTNEEYNRDSLRLGIDNYVKNSNRDLRANDLDYDKDRFERMVLDEMERQLAAVKNKSLKSPLTTPSYESPRKNENKPSTSFSYNSPQTYQHDNAPITYRPSPSITSTIDPIKHDINNTSIDKFPKNEQYRSSPSITSTIDPIKHDIDIPSPNIDPTSKAFGRGLSTLVNSDNNKSKYDKQLAYMKALDEQVSEKRKSNTNSINSPTIKAPNNRMTKSIYPVEVSDKKQIEVKLLQKQKQLQYAAYLQQQIEERKERKRQEKLAQEEYDRKYGNQDNYLPISSPSPSKNNVLSSPTPSSFGNTSFNAGEYQSERIQHLQQQQSPNDPMKYTRFQFNNLDVNQQAEIIRKQQTAQQVQNVLLQQIDAKKKEKEDEKRRLEALEAAEEARIQRDLHEMQLAYEREQQQVNQSPNQPQQYQTQLSPQQYQMQPSPQQYNMQPSPVVNQVSQSNGLVIENVEENILENNEAYSYSMSRLQESLELRKEEMLNMIKQQEYLENELQRQRNELEQWRELQNNNESNELQQVHDNESSTSRNHFIDDRPIQPARKPLIIPNEAFESKPKIHNSMDFQKMPLSPNVKSARDRSFRRHLSTDLFEKSMPNNSKLVKAHYINNNGKWDQTYSPKRANITPRRWSNNQLNSPSKASVIPPTVPSKLMNTNDQLFIDSLNSIPERNKNDLVEQSLPCASQYFIYVQPSPNDTITNTISNNLTPIQQVQTPAPNINRSQHIFDSHNDFEQSRARTAQAARMALQRASVRSDDESSYISRKSRTNSILSNKSFPSHSKDFENNYDSDEFDDSDSMSSSIGSSYVEDVSVPATPSNEQQQEIQEAKSKSTPRFQVHTPQASMVFNMESDIENSPMKQKTIYTPVSKKSIALYSPVQSNGPYLQGRELSSHGRVECSPTRVLLSPEQIRKEGFYSPAR